MRSPSTPRIVVFGNEKGGTGKSTTAVHIAIALAYQGARVAAIDLDRNQIALANTVPWRPPGNRAPSGPEMNICRPFIERQIALAEPKHLLLLGNFTARFFFGGTGTIHTLRGQWRDVAVGPSTAPAIATLHPQELLNAPASKSLAWNDLLAFQARLRDL